MSISCNGFRRFRGLGFRVGITVSKLRAEVSKLRAEGSKVFIFSMRVSDFLKMPGCPKPQGSCYFAVHVLGSVNVAKLTIKRYLFYSKLRGLDGQLGPVRRGLGGVAKIRKLIFKRLYASLRVWVRAFEGLG